MKHILPTVCSILFTISLASAAAADTEEIIDKARDYLGGDANIDRIESIHYSGTYESQDGSSGEITIIFQKPMRQRVEVNRGDLAEVSVLDNMDGWRKIFDPNDTKRRSIQFLDASRIRELQANTWENLHFFRNIEGRHGRIDNEGIVELNGREAAKLVFRHPRDITFTRYFDPDSGKLLMTETNDGAEIREYGEQTVDGILFPERIEMYRDGEKVNEIRFMEIRVNSEIDDSLFEFPSMAP